MGRQGLLLESPVGQGHSLCSEVKGWALLQALQGDGPALEACSSRATRWPPCLGTAAGCWLVGPLMELCNHLCLGDIAGCVSCQGDATGCTLRLGKVTG